MKKSTIVFLSSYVVAIVLFGVAMQNLLRRANTSSVVPPASKTSYYIVHYLPDGGLNEFYGEGSVTLQLDGITFTPSVQKQNKEVHITGYYEYVDNPTPEIIRSLRGDRKIGFSNIPEHLSEFAR